MKNNYFPFTAVTGQENIKLALILNLINPAIGGVLISGEKGTAKSTLVRSLSGFLPDIMVVNLPLGITEDRLTGGLCMEAAVKSGVVKFEKGLLSDADGQILYIDEVNLLRSHIVNVLLTVSSMGENVVEREGVSFRHACKFILIGSMNPEEGLLPSSFLDKFGLYVEAKSEKIPEKRAEIMRRRMRYESDPRAFITEFEDEEKRLRNSILVAASRLSKTFLTDTQYALCADIARQGGCAGHRCEIVIAETARALAAFNGCDVSDEDIRLAAKFALPHRIRELPERIQEAENEQVENNEAEGSKSQQDTADLPPESGQSSSCDQSPEQNSEETGEKPNLSISPDFCLKKLLTGSGKRNKVRTSSRSGSYVKARIPSGKTGDLAFDATLRAAAPYQLSRTKDGVAIAIRQSDMREKVREKRTGVTILFVVDASGSMGAGRRMRAVKGAVMALLEEAYQKRDRIGIIVFRDRGADILLNITRSVDLAERQLRSLPTGGTTPLAAGLEQALNLLAAENIRDPDALQYLVLISDGKANVPLRSDNAYNDALKAAEAISRRGVHGMVLDTEKGYIEYGFAKELCKRLDFTYVRLDRISGSGITANVNEMIRQRG